MYIYYIARASSKIHIYSLVQSTSASDFVRGQGVHMLPVHLLLHLVILRHNGRP